MGVCRRIDYIFCDAFLGLHRAGTNDLIDLGSDHRAVFAGMKISSCSPRFYRRRSSMRGWRPAESYLSAINAKLQENVPTNMDEMQTLIAEVACDHKAKPLSEVLEKLYQNDEVRMLIKKRRETTSCIE